MVMLVTGTRIWWTAISFIHFLICIQCTTFALYSKISHDQDAHERNLAIGDFDEFNNLLTNAVIRLPDISIDKGDSLNVRNLRCTDLRIGDIGIFSTVRSSAEISITLSVKQLSMTCNADYYFDGFLFFDDSGSIYVESTNNQAMLATTFTSQNFDYFPPNDSFVTQCRPSVGIDKLDFSGSIFSWILDGFVGAFRSQFEKSAEDQICIAMQQTSSENVDDSISLAEEIFASYANVRVDPLLAERNLQDFSYENRTLLNLQQTEDFIGLSAHSIVISSLDYLTIEVPTENGDGVELNVNSVIRNTLLLGRSLVIDSNEDAYLKDAFYEHHDNLFKTKFIVNTVKLTGLDTITKFEPITSIGNYTLQSEISWENLSVDLDVTIDIRPSTLPDSYIIRPGAENVNERVKISFGIDNFKALIAVLLVIDEGAVETLQLGSLLKTDNILPCVASRILKLSISALSVQALDIRPPSLSGFISQGVDQVVSSAVTAAFELYQGAFRQGSTGYFHTEVRERLNDLIQERFQEYNSIPCEVLEATGPNSAIDFRDLLLTSSQSLTLGGSGAETYGDLFPSYVVPNLKEELYEPEMANSRLIRPLTKMQSGTEGVFLLPSGMYEVTAGGSYETTNDSWTKLWDQTKIKVSNSSIKNLDTTTSPILLLEPTSSNELSNIITMGSTPSLPLTFSTNLLLEVLGQNSPLEMRNEIDISVEIPSSAFSFNALAVIDENSLLQYRLKNIGNMYCWLSIIQPPVTNHSSSSLDLNQFAATISAFYLSASCISCTSPGLKALPKIFYALEKAGLSDLLRTRIETLIEVFFVSTWNSFDIDNLLNDSRKLCPASSDYNKEAVPSNYSLPELITISRELVETAMSTFIISIYASIVIISESHRLVTTPFIDIIKEDSFGYLEHVPATVNHSKTNNLTSSIRLVDWTNLTESVGEWADMAFYQIRNYTYSLATNSMFEEAVLDQNNDEKNMNVLVQEHLLDADRSFGINFTDINMELNDIKISLVQVRIMGLDSINKLESLVVTGPEIIQNRLTFDDIKVNVDFDIEQSSNNITERMTSSYLLHQIDAIAAMHIEADIDKIGALNLGSILDIQRGASCLLNRLDDIHIVQLNITAGSFENPGIEGFISNDLREALISLGDTFFSEFRTELLSSIPLIFDTTVRSTLNTLLKQYIEHSDNNISCSVAPDATYQDDYVDFRDLLLSSEMSKNLGGSGDSSYGNLFERLYEALNQQLLNLDSSSINTMISSFTEEQSNISGALLYPGLVYEMNNTIQLAGLNADAAIKLSDVSVRNINSFGGPLEILRPSNKEGNILHNNISFGVGGRSLQLEARVLFYLTDGAEMQIRNELDVNLDITNIRMIFGILLNIAKDAFLAFPLKDISDINCWFATIFSPETEEPGHTPRTMSLIDHGISFDGIGVNISCVSCTSPHFDIFLSQLYSLDDLESRFNFPVVAARNNTSDRNSDAKNPFEYADALQLLIRNYGSSAARQCKHSKHYDKEYAVNNDQHLLLHPPSSASEFLEAANLSMSSKSAYIIFANCFISAWFLLAFLMMRIVIHKQNNVWIKSLSTKGRDFLRRQQQKEKQQKVILNTTTKSMFRSECIPKKTQYLAPLLIVANILFYLGGHFGIMSTLDIDVQLAGETFTIRSFLEFSFIESTIKTYKSGGEVMAIMVWIFTGIWPYFKLILSLFLWFIPPKLLSVSNRGVLLLWIDAITRLGIVDIFTTLVAFAVILIYLGGPDENLSMTGTFYEMKLVVAPAFSAYCLVVAQRMSRVSSKLFLDYHNKVIMAATKMNTIENIDEIQEENIAEIIKSFHVDTEFCNRDGDNVISPFNYDKEISTTNLHQQPPSTSEEGHKIKVKDSSWTGVFLVFAGVGVTVLVLGIIGCIYAPSITLDMTNIWGLVLESDTSFEQIVAKYGVFSIISTVLLQTRFVLKTTWDWVALGFLLAVCIISVGMAFFIECYRFVVRLCKNGLRDIFKRKKAKYTLPSYHRVYAFRYMEIYVVSVVIGCFQIGSVASYGIHLYCSVTYAVYNTLASIGLVEALVDNSTSQCFVVQMFLPDNLLILSLSLFILLVKFYNLAVQQYKKNITSAYLLIEEEDIETLSKVWSTDKTKGIPELEWNDTASSSNGSEIEEASTAQEFWATVENMKRPKGNHRQICLT